VIHNPVVDSSIPVKARESIDHPWLRVEDHRVILGIGRFMPQKDFPLLLRAFARVKRQANDTKLILLGDGPDRRELRSLAKDLNIEGGVDMPGFVSNPYAYLSRASLFVLSSIHEGLPTVLVEALACGCPVVSTNCPSGPDEILEGGTWGPLVPVGDVSALAQAMITTLESPPDAAQLKQRAESFSVDAAVDRYYKALFPEIDLQAA
jgi:glycosyltransferase involved in cell wall biosynthesis